MTGTSGTAAAPLDAIRRDPRAWPRSGLDRDRVAEFADLYEEGGPQALPPLEVIPDRDGTFLLCDGHHRLEALLEFGDGVDEVPVTILAVPNGKDPVEVAFERAVATSSTSSKPLTRREKRTATERLLRANAARSDREIARIAGVSPTTVGTIRHELSSPGRVGTGNDDEGEREIAPSAKQLAGLAFRALERVRETKGLGVIDGILGDRTSERLARILNREFGEEALERAIEYRTWIDGAIKHLKEVGQT